MALNSLGGHGLISLTAGESEFNWRPRRIGIAGVRFQSGGGFSTFVGDKVDDNKGGGGTDGDDGQNGKGKAGADDGQPKAPDKYELTIPDEAKTAIGDAVADIQADVEADAKANGWTNEEAQGELEHRLSRAHERLTGLRNKWLEETKADTTYGGAKLEETQQLARRVVNAIRPEGHARRDAFLRLLNGSGIGNHLEVVSFLADLGKLMGEDSPNLGKGTGKEPEVKPTATVLFPSSAPKT